MTPSELKQNVRNSGGHYFDRETMKFFGDTMANYGVRTVQVNGIACYELYRKKAVKYGNQTSAYFDAKTFKRI